MAYFLILFFVNKVTTTNLNLFKLLRYSFFEITINKQVSYHKLTSYSTQNVYIIPQSFRTHLSIKYLNCSTCNPKDLSAKNIFKPRNLNFHFRLLNDIVGKGLKLNSREKFCETKWYLNPSYFTLIFKHKFPRNKNAKEQSENSF